MSNGTLAMEIALLFLACIHIFGTFGEIYYVPKITDNMLSCEGFDNDVVNCDGLVLGSAKTDEGDDAAKLSGIIKTLKTIDSDYELDLQIWKQLDIADEFMYRCTINFCESLEDSDAPWYPILQELNISSCPVEVKDYKVSGIQISLDSVKDVLCHDFCGNYRVEMSFTQLTEQVSCHVMELSIEECDDEYD